MFEGKHKESVLKGEAKKTMFNRMGQIPKLEAIEVPGIFFSSATGTTFSFGGRGVDRVDR